MTKTRSLASALAGLILLTLPTAACSRPSGAAEVPVGSAASPVPDTATVLLLGDSVAAVESLPLTAAFAAAKVHFRSVAAAGGGNVVGPNAEEQWKELPGKISSARPNVVVYQISTFDWGSGAEQQAAYRKLLSTVTDAGAKLVIVTAPPIKPDDFYRPHMADLNRTAASARAVVQASSGRAELLDAAAVWGATYQRTRDGKVDRSTDGIHPCQQGAARFTSWLLGELARTVPGLTPPAPESWANGGWTTDKHFQGC